MAIGVLIELPGVTREHYEAVNARLTGGGKFTTPSQLPVSGLLAHIAGPTANRWRVVDVWESEEAFRAFGAHLMPLFAEFGLKPPTPEIFSIENFVKA